MWSGSRPLWTWTTRGLDNLGGAHCSADSVGVPGVPVSVMGVVVAVDVVVVVAVVVVGVVAVDVVVVVAVVVVGVVAVDVVVVVAGVVVVVVAGVVVVVVAGVVVVVVVVVAVDVVVVAVGVVVAVDAVVVVVGVVAVVVVVVVVGVVAVGAGPAGAVFDGTVVPVFPFVEPDETGFAARTTTHPPAIRRLPDWAHTATDVPLRFLRWRRASSFEAKTIETMVFESRREVLVTLTPCARRTTETVRRPTVRGRRM
jgi:hypothetical protein